MTRVDYEGSADAYRRLRTLPPAVLDAWAEAVGSLAPAPVAPVVDVGAGTGQFLAPLRAWFGGPVVAIEPSPAMRAEAAAPAAAAGAALVAGEAERLPLVTGCAGVAWLSTVVHQLDDRPAAAAELRRVVRPGGCVLVRGFFADQAVTGLHALFPGIERARATFPTTAAVAGELAAAGFAPRAVIDVVEPWAAPLGTWLARVRSLRPFDSALRPLTDAEIDAGLAAIERRWRHHRGPVPGPVTLRLLAMGG